MTRDDFNGDTAQLCASIEALLDLDASGALVPHGIGGHARGLLSAAFCRLNASLPAAEDAQGWRPIETAPKSTADGDHIHGIYLLGFCPDPDTCNLESAVCVVWWEPLMNGGKGMWYGEGGYQVYPTHWMPLPKIPTGD